MFILNLQRAICYPARPESQSNKMFIHQSTRSQLLGLKCHKVSNASTPTLPSEAAFKIYPCVRV